MKQLSKLRLSLILVSLPFFSIYAQPPHSWQSKGSGITLDNYTMISVSAVDSNTAWGAAYHLPFSTAFREFVRTTDGGLTWSSGVIDSLDGGTFNNLAIQ